MTSRPSFLKWIMICGVIFAIIFLGLFFILPVHGDIPVLMYHYIEGQANKVSEGNLISPGAFQKQMDYLKLFGFHPISLEEYEKIRKGEKPPQGREVLLTFDDGHRDFYDYFYPVLRQMHYPSVAFLISESVKQHLNGSMTEEMIREIVKDELVTMAAHTKTHPDLTKVTAEQLKEEVDESKKYFETTFEIPFNYFSYPLGVFNQQVLDQVKKSGYHLAFTTSPKKLGELSETDFSITRVKMSEDESNPVLFLVRLSGIYQNVKRFGHTLKNSFQHKS